MRLKKNTLFIIAGMSLTFMSCSNDAPSTKPGSKGTSNLGQNNSGNAATLSLSEQIAAREKEISERSTQKKQNSVDLAIQRTINAKLCERLYVYRTECPIASRIMGAQSDVASFGCVANTSDIAAKVSVKYNATISGTAAKFKIIADNDYETQEIMPGVATDLNFSTLGDTSSAAPRLVDLSSLKLKKTSADALPAIAAVDIAFKANDTVIFTKADLLPIEGSTSSFKLNLSALQPQRSSPKCRVMQDEIDLIISTAKKATSAVTNPAASTTGGVK